MAVDDLQNFFCFDIQRFGESHEEGLGRLRSNISGWFFTVTAKEMAAEKLSRREKEKAVEHGTAR